jgi:hypothetical protein
MRHRRQILATLAVVALFCVSGAGRASAQMSADPCGGTRIQVCPAVELLRNTTVGIDLDFFTRLRMGVFSMYSWGAGATVRPGTLRSSFAVLRERRGLMR